MVPALWLADLRVPRSSGSRSWLVDSGPRSVIGWFEGTKIRQNLKSAVKLHSLGQYWQNCRRGSKGLTVFGGPSIKELMTTSTLSVQGSPLVTTMLVRTNLDVTTKFWGSKKDQMRVCYSKMHGCNDIPLVRTIFSRDERSRYKRASLYCLWRGGWDRLKPTYYQYHLLSGPIYYEKINVVIRFCHLLSSIALCQVAL